MALRTGRTAATSPAWADITNDPPEGLSAPESRQVAAVLDGDTIALRDGGTLRLAGIEAPKPQLAPGDTGMAALANQAADALRPLAGDGTLLLRYDALRRDRYGRALAQAFSPNGTWLQAGLVTAGLARVHGDGANRRGLRTLLGLEESARKDGRGLWRHPFFAVRAADAPGLVRLAGRFEIVAGRVAAAAVVKDLGFVNFGADHRTDLTLVVKRPALALMDAAKIDLPHLAGRQVRCRGWLDLHDGPSLEITYPEQIELLEEP